MQGVMNQPWVHPYPVYISCHKEKFKSALQIRRTKKKKEKKYVLALKI